jgi:hypothetical protein
MSEIFWVTIFKNFADKNDADKKRSHQQRLFQRNDTMNYNDKKFRPISNTENGETSNETLFHYKQIGNILTSEYSGGKIKYGHLMGLVDKSGKIEMRYHQVNDKDELMTGICISKPEILKNGKIRLHENW